VPEAGVNKPALDFFFILMLYKHEKSFAFSFLGNYGFTCKHICSKHDV